MPRQDVPYGGAICRLKERIAEIWDKLGEKIHSINGVEGDAVGDVKIVSADPAVVITNNAASHEIEIGLDSLELPSAAVQSVNGQTGAVALDAGDIPSDNGDVQADLDALALRVTANGTAISNEVIDRQNADATLQTNINAALASIPEMSVTPDPYKGVERDAQGRAFAADPASGATDKSLTTANWISQTGAGKPNNLLHDTGNETKNGQLTMTLPGVFTTCIKIAEFSTATSGTSIYRLMFKIARSSITSYFRNVSVFMEIGRANVTRGLTYILLSIHQGNVDGVNVFNIGRTNTETIKYAVTYDADYVYVYRKNESNYGISSNSFLLFQTFNGDPTKFYPTFTQGTTSDDTTTYTGTLIQEVTMS